MREKIDLEIVTARHAVDLIAAGQESEDLNTRLTDLNDAFVIQGRDLKCMQDEAEQREAALEEDRQDGAHALAEMNASIEDLSAEVLVLAATADELEDVFDREHVLKEVTIS